MRGDTHSDTERWKTCWERHSVITKRDSWSGPNPSQLRRFTCRCASKPPHYHLFYHSVFLKARHDDQREEWERGMDRKGKTPLIYMPLGNRDCISLSCAIVYCVWLSNEKNGTVKRWAGCWAIKAALCVVACQHWWPSAPANLVSQTHNRALAQAKQGLSSSYTLNSSEVPNQTQKTRQFTLGYTDTHWY